MPIVTLTMLVVHLLMMFMFKKILLHLHSKFFFCVMSKVLLVTAGKKVQIKSIHMVSTII
jgi:hypothetical protein